MFEHGMLRGPRRLAILSLVGLSVYVPTVLAANGDASLSPDQIAQKVLQQGYAKVIRMEMEDGVYEVKAKTGDGKRVNLDVDPKSGKILGAHKDGLLSD